LAQDRIVLVQVQDAAVGLVVHRGRNAGRAEGDLARAGDAPGHTIRAGHRAGKQRAAGRLKRLGP
jgi:hypothetical protein